MKKLAKYSCINLMNKLMILFGFLIITTCSQDDVNDLNSKEVAFTKNNILNNVDISKIQNPIYLEGNFSQWVTNKNELVIYTETESYNHIFVLQGDKYSKFNIPSNQIESIAFLDHSFIVHTKGLNYYFGVSKEAEKLILSQIPDENKNFKEIVYGNGVIHNWSKKGNSFDLKELKMSNSVIDYFNGFKSSLSGDTACTSGGPGSTSCSVGGCSVSCSSGYYSCCKDRENLPDTCTCIQISGDQ